MTQRRWTWQQQKLLRALSTKTGRDPISCPHFSKMQAQGTGGGNSNSALSGPGFSNILQPLTPNSGSSWIIHADLRAIWMSHSTAICENLLCYLPIISTARLSAPAISLRQLLLNAAYIHLPFLYSCLSLPQPLSALCHPTLPYSAFLSLFFNLSRDTTQSVPKQQQHKHDKDENASAKCNIIPISPPPPRRWNYLHRDRRLAYLVSHLNRQNISPGCGPAKAVSWSRHQGGMDNLSARSSPLGEWRTKDTQKYFLSTQSSMITGYLF